MDQNFRGMVIVASVYKFLYLLYLLYGNLLYCWSWSYDTRLRNSLHWLLILHLAHSLLLYETLRELKNK